MRTKGILVAVCFVAFAAVVLMLLFANSTKDAGNRTLRAEVQALKNENEELRKARASQAQDSGELVRLRRENEDLLRLRNEVRQLRQEKQQLAQKVQTAQSETERAQLQAQAARALASRATPNPTTSSGQYTVPGSAPAPEQQNANACINNLRQIDGAKQQWALENKKTADSVPTGQDLAPYFRNNPLPACPAGGAYVLNAVGAEPTCSIPGHALPRQ